MTLYFAGCRDRLKDVGVIRNNWAEIGAGYDPCFEPSAIRVYPAKEFKPSVGVTPELVYPFVAEVEVGEI